MAADDADGADANVVSYKMGMETRYSFGGDDHIFVEVDEEMSLDAFFKSLSMTSWPDMSPIVPLTLKLIVSPGAESAIAWRRLPGPLSFRFVTVIVAALTVMEAVNRTAARKEIWQNVDRYRLS